MPRKTVVLAWVLATIIFQLAVYGYLDRFLLAPAASFSQKLVDGEIAAGYSTMYSYDSAYYAEVSKQGAKLYSASGKKLLNDIKLNNKEIVTYFSWLPEKNVALMGISQDSSSGCTVTLKVINLETGSQPAEPRIGGLSKGSKIVDVVFSDQTNVVYMLLRSGSGTSVYRTDANNKLSRMYLKTRNVNKIACLNNQDALLYCNQEEGRVFIVDSAGRHNEIAPSKNQYALIGVDKMDNVYIGKLTNQKLVSSVMVGKASSDFTEYKKLDDQYSPDSLKITFDGRLIFC